MLTITTKIGAVGAYCHQVSFCALAHHYLTPCVYTIHSEHSVNHFKSIFYLLASLFLATNRHQVPFLCRNNSPQVQVSLSTTKNKPLQAVKMYTVLIVLWTARWRFPRCFLYKRFLNEQKLQQVLEHPSIPHQIQKYRTCVLLHSSEWKQQPCDRSNRWTSCQTTLQNFENCLYSRETQLSTCQFRSFVPNGKNMLNQMKMKLLTSLRAVEVDENSIHPEYLNPHRLTDNELVKLIRCVF